MFWVKRGCIRGNQVSRPTMFLLYAGTATLKFINVGSLMRFYGTGSVMAVHKDESNIPWIHIFLVSRVLTHILTILMYIKMY